MNQETRTKIGSEIRNARKIQRMTQQQLADSIGLKQRQISDVERGADEDDDRYKAIAYKLGIIIDERFEELDIFKSLQEDEDIERIVRRMDKLIKAMDERSFKVDSIVLFKILEIASK